MKKIFYNVIAIFCCFIACTPTNNTQKQNFPQHIQSSLISPQRIEKKGNNHYFIDFGKDAFGTLSLLFKTAPTDTLIIHLGEKLSDKNTIDRSPGGTIRYQKVVLTKVQPNQKFLLQLPANKRNTNHRAVALPKSMGVVMPFRYCEIENLNIPLSKVNIKQKVFNYRFNDNASSFTCSDTVLNQVWELCKHTIKATSFCGLYIDGDRERIPYEADALINQLSHYCVDDEYSLAQKTNEYFIDHPTWPTEWILHTVLLFYYDYQYTGDTTEFAKYYNKLKEKMLMDLERKDGLISSNSPRLNPDLIKKIGFKNSKEKIHDIVDWPQCERDDYEMVSVNTVVNSFYYKNLEIMAQMAAILGHKKDTDFFSQKAIAVKKTINEKLLNPSTGIYVDGEGSKHSSLHANMFPLAFGIVPKENIGRVTAFIKSKGMACSVYGAQYLLDALYKNGEADYALSLMNSTNGDRNWWNMIKTGATMTMEAWDQKYKTNLDWNHAWGTAPANIITRQMWGIRPALPGFEKALIKPQLSNLTFSNIKVPTIKGPILADFKQINARKEIYTIELPAGMTGIFIVTAPTKTRITLNGNPVKSATKKLALKSGTNRIIIE